MRHVAIHVAIVTMLSGLLAIGGPSSIAAEPARVATPIAGTADAPVLTVLDSFLAMLNGGPESLTLEDFESRLAPAFLEGIPTELVLGAIQQVAADAPYELEGFSRPPTAYQANAVVRGGSGVPIVFPIAVEPEAPHRITGMTFAPVPLPPGVDLSLVPVGTAPLAAGEVRRSETGRLDGLFDVGGRQMYLSCVGEGSPAVVLESGMGDPAAPWLGVESAVAGFTRVCSFDRPNTAGSASDPAPKPRDLTDAVDDLRTLLEVAEVPGPYVLVGHSFGGLIVRMFAGEYPEDVGGIVLVDSSHEEQVARLEAMVTPEQWQEFITLQEQFTGAFEFDLDASLDQMRLARQETPLPPMPLVVITAGMQVAPGMLPPGWPVEVLEQVHGELQVDLASLVPGGRQVVAERSGHYIHQTEPDLVIAAIRDVVDAVRDPAAWATPDSGTPVPVSSAGTPAP